MTSLPIAHCYEVAARLVADTRDLLEARPAELAPPAALVDRGWASFLASLDDAELEALESHADDADWPARTPSTLRDLARRIHELCALPSCAPEAASPSRTPRRRETPRKRAQIDAFAALVLPLATRARRVVDVGSGHGHLTRALASLLALPVIGLERDVLLTNRARGLSGRDTASFEVTDVLEDGMPFLAGDCAIGLHACGELGDAMTEVAARQGASIALVGCCLQKRRALTRRPLVVHPALTERLELPRAVLGLSNLMAGDVGVEATRVENLEGRTRRLALHRLLSAHDPALPLGAEIEGLNRRVAQRPLPLLVARAFALRGLPAPSDEAVADAMSFARVAHASSRRLSLPRAMLARLLEVYVLLDRARYLEERGYSVTVGVLFPAAVSARNLALIGHPR